jgi:hypothetical protein
MRMSGVYSSAILCVCFLLRSSEKWGADRRVTDAKKAAQTEKSGAARNRPAQKRRSLRLLGLAHPPPRLGISGTVSSLPTDAAWSSSYGRCEIAV